MKLKNVKSSQSQMPSSGQEHARLRLALALLARNRIIPVAPATLRRGVTRLCTSLRQTVIEETPAFSASGNPHLLSGLDRHIGEHVAELQRLLAGGELADFEFVKLHVQRRAEQRFPLEATLQAYRCGHKALALWIQQIAAIRVGDGHDARAEATLDVFADEYTNTISTIATAAYVAHTRVLAGREGDHRSE